MLVYQPSRYLGFLSYCKQRKLFCKAYQRLKDKKALGEITQQDYFKQLKTLHHSVIELEIEYFDILHMRL